MDTCKQQYTAALPYSGCRVEASITSHKLMLDTCVITLANDEESAAADIIAAEPFEGVVLSATRERSDSMLYENATYAGRSAQKESVVALVNFWHGRQIIFSEVVTQST